MQGVDLREYEVCVHGDNCSKEINCNSIARLLSLLVSRRQVRRAQLPHTLHDQFFSVDLLISKEKSIAMETASFAMFSIEMLNLIAKFLLIFNRNKS